MAAGIDTGGYFYSQAITVAEAIDEANYVLTLLDGRKLTGPVVYDWEMHDSTYRVYGISAAMATACAKAFCDTIQSAGYQAAIYSSSYVAYNKFDLSALKDYPLWYPEYKNAGSTALYPQLYYQMDYWQYTDKGSVAGLPEGIDCDLQFVPIG
jgi:GH25 family lysozyme M1 (1,4-beta-N-acetylmuramidase)